MEMYRDLLVETGIHEDTYDDRNAGRMGMIPSHSHLMQAWVFAGVLGAVFWGYALVLVMRGVVRATVLRPTLSPIYCYLCVSVMWDILFSPFGYTSRIVEAFLLVVVCDLVNSASAPARRSSPACGDCGSSRGQ